MRIRQLLAVCAGAALLLPAASQAQDREGMWSVSVRGGPLMYAEASALEPGINLGLEAVYSLTPLISVGPSVDFVYGKSNGEFFVAAMPFSPDSTRVFEVGQQLSVLHYGGVARFDVLRQSRLGAYLVGGGGGYSIYLESASNDVARRVNGLMLQGGAGVSMGFSENAGVSLDVRDMIYTGFDREELNPIRARHQNCGSQNPLCFPGAQNDVPEAKETLHNLRFTLGFTYVPRGGGN